MDSTGYIYVPSGCLDKMTVCNIYKGCRETGCKVLKGVKGTGLPDNVQRKNELGNILTRETIQDTYVRNAGYNEVGEMNNIIILYPQAKPSAVNPNGCWDWWGYSGDKYATRRGIQPRALKKMMNRVKGKI